MKSLQLQSWVFIKIPYRLSCIVFNYWVVLYLLVSKTTKLHSYNYIKLHTGLGYLLLITENTNGGYLRFQNNFRNTVFFSKGLMNSKVLHNLLRKSISHSSERVSDVKQINYKHFKLALFFIYDSCNSIWRNWLPVQRGTHPSHFIPFCLTYANIRNFSIHTH